MEQFDQLLTCCICLDRYRNPKLLPCQHSYCMEPCMEGLVDYVKRQVKCPECRAEHRIPYNGIQGFPTNYTLQKFLELHAEITGELPDPNADAIMSRCNVCSEKAYVNPCAHCDKKCCDDCREAHCDILKREISRVNNQVKRGWHRLEDCIQQVDRNSNQLQQNAASVLNEIEDMHHRLSNVLKERTEFLKSSVDKYLIVESKTLKDLKENLELELANIKSNADLMEKHMSDDTKWDDNELMDCKDIFIKMMDFIRNYDPGTEEYTRRIRFTTHDAINDLAKKMLEIGDLKFHDPKPKEELSDDLPIRSSGLSRSKSDHRLVAEFRRREEAERSPPLRRRFGESRYSREENKSRTNFGRYDEDDDDGRPGGRFRSRFLRPDDDDDTGGGNRSSMYEESGDKKKSERIKVVETEDCSRGPLSGCIRLADSSRVIQRLKEMEMAKIKPPKKKEEPPPIPKFVPLKPDPSLLNAPIRLPGQPTAAKKEEEPKPESAVVAQPAATTAAAVSGRLLPTGASRQVSTESSSSSESSVDAKPAAAAPAPQQAANNEEEEEDDDEYEYYEYETDEEEEEEAAAAPPPAAKPQVTAPVAPAPTPKPPERKTSMYSTPATTTTTSSYVPYSSRTATTTTAAAAVATTTTSSSGPRAYGGARTMPNIASLASSEAVKAEDPPVPTADQSVAEMTQSITARYRRLRDDSDSFVNKYLAKSRGASVDPTSTDNRSSSSVASNLTTGDATKKSSAPGDLTGRSRYAALRDRRSRVARSKSSAVLGLGSRAYDDDDDDDDEDDDDDDDNDDSVQTPFTSRFGRELAKSRSSHYLKTSTAAEDSDSGLPSSSAALTSDDDNLSSWARYLKNKYGSKSRKSSNNKDEQRNNEVNSYSQQVTSSKQSVLMTFGSRGSQPGLFTWPRGIAVGPDNSIVVADSSNHRVQVFNEHGQHRFSFGCYGNGEGEFDCLAGVAVNKIGQYIIADRYNHRIQIFDSAGHFIRSFGSQGTVDSKFSYPWGITTDALGLIYVCDKENHRVQVFQSDGSFVSKFGVMGSKPGHLEHPHYIAVSNTSRVIVSDSNNHRIQIFDVNGKVLTTFGSEGTDAGQFKFPRGVSVDEKGYIYVADSGNNRIQIFNPDGTFLRCFGRWGQGEGEFKGLEGIAVNSKGNILVADRENHRVQIF